MIKIKENLFHERNLVFQTTPAGAPANTPSATPSAVPSAAPEEESPTQVFGRAVAIDHSREERGELKEEIDDPKKLVLAFESEFSKRVMDIMQTVDEAGQKYKFDKWLSNANWGENKGSNEICEEIRTVCKDFPLRKSVDTMIAGLKDTQSNLHAQCVATLERCVKNLHEKQKIMDTAQTKVEEAHDIPVAKGISDMFKNFSSFYSQQDGAGKVALIGSLFFIGKLLTDKELMEKESPFGCTWKQFRNMALAGLGLNYVVAAVRDDHEAPISFGLDKKFDDVPYVLRAVLEKAGVKDAAQIAALGRISTFDKADMTEWYNLYLQARGTGSINPEQTPFNFYNLTAQGSEQRGRDLYKMMQVMVADAVSEDAQGNIIKGEEAFKRKYLEDPNIEHTFMSIAYGLNYFSKPEKFMTREAADASREVIEKQLIPVLEKEGPLGDFEPKINEDGLSGYLKSVPVGIEPMPKSSGDNKFTFKVAVSDTDVIHIDPSADKAALRGQLETLDGYLKKDIERRILNHKELQQGKEPIWVSEGRYAISDVTIAGTHYDKVYVTAHQTESDKFFLQYGKMNILCGTGSLEMSDRNAVYAERIVDYPGKPFEGLYVHVASTEKNGSKVTLKGEIARTPFKAELDEATGALKMLEFDYNASNFTNEKRINATNSIFPKDIFHKLGNLARMAPENIWKDSIDEGYWKGLVEFKHYEALNIYESFLKRAKTPEDVAAADRRLANALQEVKNLHAQISKEIGAEGATVSEADFAEWTQGLDNMNFWYSNNEYRKFMLDVRESLKDKDFEGLGEDEYQVFMLIYREVSDSTGKFSVLDRNLNNYEKAYLEYVKEQIRQLVLQSENDKPGFSLTVKGIKGLLEHVDEAIKPDDVRRFLNIQPYHEWARDNNVPASYMDVDTEPIPDGTQPEVLPDGRFTERGAYLGLQVRYNRVKNALAGVDEKELKDKGKFYTELTEKINKRYDDSKKIAGLPTRAKQDAELKNYVADLRAICKNHLSAAGYAKFIDSLPTELKR